MLRRGKGGFGKVIDAASLRRWSRLAAGAETAELGALRRQRIFAAALAERLGRLIRTADSRLALPRVGSTNFERPLGTDWAWRPAPWRGPLGGPGLVGVESRTQLGELVTLFHDCPHAELSLRQGRALDDSDLAPFVLRLDVFRFSGSFLSLVLDLPAEATVGLRRSHVIRAQCRLSMERPIEVFVRLNVQHGPNTEQMVQELPRGTTEGLAEFDLAYSNLNEKREARIWVDLILENPQMNQITVHDLTFARYPRAPL